MLYREWNGKRRGTFDIIDDILRCSLEPKGITQVMHKANLSYSQCREYLKLAISANLLEERSKKYKITQKGKEFISKYQEIRNILNSS